MRVDDGTGDSVFVLFDSDVHYLLEKQCSVLVAKSKVCELTDLFVWFVLLDYCLMLFVLLFSRLALIG